MSGTYVLDLTEIDATRIAVAGGKGAQLGELTRIGGIRVPPGFCVTTEGFREVMTNVPAIGERLDELAAFGPDDRVGIAARSAELRQAIETVVVPDDLVAAVRSSLDRFGARSAYAVRSSATAEDLPTASFAGLQDTYLNVEGPEAILRHVSRCWASTFTERAVTYRIRHGLGHHEVLMAVVVQQMILPECSGVMFTADPVTSNRRVVSVEASFGLGEALVSGLVNADVYEVRDGEIRSRAIGTKQLAVVAAEGGTRQEEVEPERQARPALTDAQVLRLAQLGRRIEGHLGSPQDIEWCLRDDEVHIVQSRPITTLFPIPSVDDDENHVFVSVGHQQMMTDPMTPLGVSVKQLTSLPPMPEAAGRLFVDVTRALASPATRAGIVEGLGRSDPLIGDALETLLERDGFLPPPPADGPPVGAFGDPPPPLDADPAVVEVLMERSRSSLAALRRDIAATTGPALFDFLLEDFAELKRLLVDPLSYQVLMAGMDSSFWLNERLESWLGEKGAADTLTLSVPHNVTAEMGLALLDVADVIRPHPEVIAFLQGTGDDGFLAELTKLDGGTQARDAIQSYLDLYGMRCVGEIDITTPRWAERPRTLVPMILSNVKDFEPGEAGRRFERGRQEAADKEADLLERLQALPDGDLKAAETKRMIDRVRTFAGYREYPKYGIVCRYLIYKQALLAEAVKLVEDGVVHEAEDVFFLTFDEFREAVRTGVVDPLLIARRKDEFRSARNLTPPRVLTSDGEVVAGSYRRDGLPPGALVGLPVSVGTVEGRARVILDLADADVEPGDILVTTFTDPSWSPLFVAVAGLVTEVGGLMTHGAVIAREYGLPAVVGVEAATRRIQDGDRIRLNGTDGYVEILPSP